MCRGCDALKRPSGERNTQRKTVQATFSLILAGHETIKLQPSIPVRDTRTTSMGEIARKESFRVISTARLRTSPPVHLPPIDVVVCNDPKRRSHLEVGFVLRCFQHLSVPDAATRPCPWRDNRLAGGRSNTVLSY